MILACHSYDTTNHDQVIKKERAKILCSQEYYSSVDALTSTDQNGGKQPRHHAIASLPKLHKVEPSPIGSSRKGLISPVSNVRNKNFGKELEKVLSMNVFGADTIC